MSATESKTNSILVLGAGELGIAVLHALSEQRSSASSPKLTVLLCPLPEGEAAAAASEQANTLRALGADILRVDLASEAEDGLVVAFASFSTVICCTGFVGGRGTAQDHRSRPPCGRRPLRTLAVRRRL